MLPIGTPAPDFTLSDQDGEIWTLSKFKGARIVLFFYSKDMTSGCTKQVCSFAELYQQFLEDNIIVFGVSRDSGLSHKRFASLYRVPYPLLSDPERAAIEAYDVWQEKKKAGKTTMGVVRTSYLIDENGIIVGAYNVRRAADNAEDMLKEIYRIWN